MEVVRCEGCAVELGPDERDRLGAYDYCHDCWSGLEDEKGVQGMRVYTEEEFEELKKLINRLVDTSFEVADLMDKLFSDIPRSKREEVEEFYWKPFYSWYDLDHGGPLSPEELNVAIGRKK